MAEARMRENPAERGPQALADLFCRSARRRIAERFRAARHNDDAVRYAVAQQVLGGKHAWVEEGAISALLEEVTPKAPAEPVGAAR